MEKTGDNQKLIERRKLIIKKLCDKIQCPGLIWAFSDPINESISEDFIREFRSELARTILNISEGNKCPLPSNTDPYHLPAYVAIENPEGGIKALYNFGYRPSWESPKLIGEKYEVKFYLPDSTPITFLTGPAGSFSVFSLWLNMRIICAEKDEKRSLRETQPTVQNDIFSKMFNATKPPQHHQNDPFLNMFG